MKAGDIVETKTTSGMPILCVVIGPADEAGEWVLNSRRHGFLIQRSRHEFKLLRGKRKADAMKEIGGMKRRGDSQGREGRRE